MMKFLTLSAVAAVGAVALTLTQTEPALAQGCGFNQFDAEFRNLTTNYPQRSQWGARDVYQYSYFLGMRGLAILDGHRPCMTDPDYQANRQALEGMRDQGLRGCQQLSADPSTCTATYPAS